MFTLSPQTKRNIEQIVGLPVERIIDMTTEEEIQHIQQRTGKPLVFSRKKSRKHINRGNVYLATGKITFPEVIAKKLEKLR